MTGRSVVEGHSLAVSRGELRERSRVLLCGDKVALPLIAPMAGAPTLRLKKRDVRLTEVEGGCELKSRNRAMEQSK
jgi:hypothetical protein